MYIKKIPHDWRKNLPNTIDEIRIGDLVHLQGIGGPYIVFYKTRSLILVLINGRPDQWRIHEDTF